jgi:riboflavin kinase / FMN adenylyltransferase
MVVTFPDKLDLPLGAVVAVGNFDGVHAGHRELLRVAKEKAEALGLPLAVLTFEPHPRTVLFPEKPLRRLSELPEKVMLLEDVGVDVVAVMPFTLELAGWSPERFAGEALRDWLKAKVVVVGENFRYGKKASGDVASLRAYGAGEGGFEVVAVPLVMDAGGVVSSSRLRAS